MVDLVSIFMALGIAGSCVILAGAGLGVLLVAWGSFMAWGMPASFVVTTFYLASHPVVIPTPWKK